MQLYFHLPDVSGWTIYIHVQPHTHTWARNMSTCYITCVSALNTTYTHKESVCILTEFNYIQNSINKRRLMSLMELSLPLMHLYHKRKSQVKLNVMMTFIIWNQQELIFLHVYDGTHKTGYVTLLTKMTEKYQTTLCYITTQNAEDFISTVTEA